MKTTLTNNPGGNFAYLDETEPNVDFLYENEGEICLKADQYEYALDLLRDGEISPDKFREELRSIGYGDEEITEIIAEETD